MKLKSVSLVSMCKIREVFYQLFYQQNVYFTVNLRCVGGEVGATSSLAPKIGPLGLVSKKYLLITQHNLVYGDDIQFHNLSVFAHKRCNWVCYNLKLRTYIQYFNVVS